jgi:hypothetical protein
MKRAMPYVLIALFAFAGYGVGVGVAQEKMEKMEKAATKGELRWHGTIVRWSKDQSTLDVRKGNVVKTIHYDSSTQWTQAAGGKVKPAEMSEFTEGSDVICMGKAGEKGSFMATRIDLRAKGQKP